MKHIVTWSLVITLFIAFTPSEGSAYLDPGAGSNYLQNIIGGLFSFLAAVKNFFTRLFSFRKSEPGEKEEK